jgi:hypothetical protein
MYGAGDVRIADVADPAIHAPADAIVRVVRAAICGSDLHPYRSMPATSQGRQTGHEFLGIVEDTGAEVTGLKEAHVPAGHRSGADAPRLVRPDQPDGIDLRERPEDDKRRAGEQDITTEVGVTKGQPRASRRPRSSRSPRRPRQRSRANNPTITAGSTATCSQ